MKKKEAKATGTNVLVELLSAGEAFGSSFIVPNESKLPALQGIVLDIGPQIKPEDFNFKVGDRVVLFGDYVPIPREKTDTNERKLVIFPMHAVKCVINY